MVLYDRSDDSGHNVPVDIKSGAVISLLGWIGHPKSGQSSKMWSIIPNMDLSFSRTEIITKVDQSESVISKMGM